MPKIVWNTLYMQRFCVGRQECLCELCSVVFLTVDPILLHQQWCVWVLVNLTRDSPVWLSVYFVVLLTVAVCIDDSDPITGRFVFW